MNNFISVVIPTYKNWELLIKCLNALENQSLSQEQFEVIVVDNDGTEKFSTRPGVENFKILVERQPGSYVARNLGIKNAKGQIIAFTDSDCIPHEDWLKTALELLNNNSHVDRIAGNVELIHKNPNNPNWIELYEDVFAFQQKRNATEGYSVTANLFVRKDVFKKVGLFDESLLSGGDVEWGKRATKNQVSLVYGEKVVIYHPSRNKISDLIKKTIRVYHGIEYRRYLNKKFLDKIVHPIYLLRPPLNKISSSKEIRTKTIIFLIEYILRFSKIYAHLKATLTNKLNRQ